MDGAGEHGRRPRPVAEVPAPDAAALAKAWLLALVADAPLVEAAAVPMAELVHGGPALCAGIVAALSSEAELERLTHDQDGREPIGAGVARLTGARTPDALATAVEALRAVTWRALRRDLHDADPLQVADLADRLAHVCSRVVTASLAALVGETRGRVGPLGEAWEPGPAATADGPPPPPPVGVLPVDLPLAPPPRRDPLSSLSEELSAAPPTGITGTRPAAYAGLDAQHAAHLHALDATWEPAAQPAPPWLAAIKRRLERRHADGLPFAVLIVEIDDLDRLLAAAAGPEIGLALEAAERSLTAELAPADLVVRERLGRWWLTSPDRDGDSARDLGRRVAEAIARVSGSPGSPPLKASIGLAQCPDDGEDLDALASRADEGMFAARAAGVPIA